MSGQSKIIEYFVVQHALFPVVATPLVLRPIEINFLQLEHILVNTFLFASLLVLLSLRPGLLDAFFGPRTGARVATL